MRFRLIIIFMLFFGLLSFNVNAEVEGSDFKLVFTTTNCNCDADCEASKGCVTRTTDDFVTTLSDRTYDKIEDANKEGYNGICASMLLSNNPIEWVMTESCNSQLECTTDSACNSGYECTDYQCVEKPPECTKDSDCKAGYECKSGECEKKESYCRRDKDCKDGFECVDRECKKKKQQNVSSRVVKINFSEDENSSAEDSSVEEIMGGIDMDVVSVSIVSATIIVIGFFALMAWTAYLLQKKSQGK